MTLSCRASENSYAKAISRQECGAGLCLYPDHVSPGNSRYLGRPIEVDHIDLKGERIFIRRLKNGVDSTQPLSGIELRYLKQLRRRNPTSSWCF
jgi:hypothetical protein